MTQTDVPATTRELRSLVTDGHPDGEGRLRLSIDEVPLAPPGPDDVIVRVEAAPINPSDLGLLLANADLTTAQVDADGAITATIRRGAMPSMHARYGKPMSVGNEGAGTVIAAGSSPAAQALVGKLVTLVAGGMYAQHRKANVAGVRALPPGTTARDGASAFVNPMTALAFLDTMRREGHTAIVHTAAASNLGQMVNRACLADGVGLVNIVRRREQAELLRGQGAKHVLDSTSATFAADLVTAIAETGATLAFDAIGGGDLGSQILGAMETVAARTGPYSRYGSTTHKQLYIYGALDHAPTQLKRTFGMAWGVGGWLVSYALAKAGPQRAKELGDRVLAELKTTFASAYSHEIGLAQALDLPTLLAYAKMASGAKYLLRPDLG